MVIDIQNYITVNVCASLVGQNLLIREELVPGDISWHFGLWSDVPLLRSVEEQWHDVSVE